MSTGGEMDVLGIYERLGELRADIRHKAGKEDISSLHARHIELLGQSEQRGSDLHNAGMTDVRREIKRLEDMIDVQSQAVIEIKTAIDNQSASLSAIREMLTAKEASTINWFEWARWILILIAIVIAIVTRDFGLLLDAA